MVKHCEIKPSQETESGVAVVEDSQGRGFESRGWIAKNLSLHL